jgi:hypothetical protein
MDAWGPWGNALTLEGVANGFAMDAELSGELLDPAASSVGGDQLYDLSAVEAPLSLLRRARGAFVPDGSGQTKQGSETSSWSGGSNGLLEGRLDPS